MAMQVAGPVRGTYNAEGRFFAVAGNTLFQITAGGISVPLGTVPGVGRVSFSHNQITNGNEILVNNGNSGYIYNTVTQVFQRITDTSYPGGLRAVFINNRFVQIEPARRYLFNSALADGLSYTALDRFTSETSPDLAMSIESIGNQLAVFSSTTTEWFEDTGANPQPFRSTGIVADKGAAGPFATAKMDNQLFFLADDGVFYRYQGYNPVRISTKPIEQAIRNKNWFNAFTTVWEDSGYAVCYWTFPDGHTWGYDASAGKWHRRESYGLSRWRLNSLTYWQNAWYGGDFQNGRLWQLDWDYLLEGDQEFESIRACGVIADNQNRVIHERLELVMNTGMVETVPVSFEGQPEGPAISGEAPDAGAGAAYSFAYTTTPGDNPIARTVLMPGSYIVVGGVQKPIPNNGWTWNQATATISNAAPPITSVVLKLRVYDTAGLFAEHEDSFEVLEASEVLVSGQNESLSSPYMCSFLTTDISDITGIPQASGATQEDAVGAYGDGGWCVVANGTALFAPTLADNWTSATAPATQFAQAFPDSASGFIASVSPGSNIYGSTGGANFSLITRTAVTPGHQANLTNAYRTFRLFNPNTEAYEWWSLNDQYMFTCDDPLTDSWETRYRWLNTSMAARLVSDVVWHEGLLYACGVVEASTYGVCFSSDNGATWSLDDIIFRAVPNTSQPVRIFSVGGDLVVYCNTGTLRCMSSGWEIISLGITGVTSGGDIPLLAEVRSRAVVIGELLYVVGTGDDGNKIVTFNPATQEVSEPTILPITAAVSIAPRRVE
jgi:hypothetical protein